MSRLIVPVIDLTAHDYRRHMKYLVVVEKSGNGFGAYVPDLPGCLAVADTREDVVTLIQEAIEFHIEGLKESGDPVPQPTAQSELVDVHAA